VKAVITDKNARPGLFPLMATTCPAFDWMMRCDRLHQFAGFALATVQTLDASLPKMIVLFQDGSAFGGADDLVPVARRIWWSWRWFVLGEIADPVSPLGFKYQAVAVRRHCSGGKSKLPGTEPIPCRHRIIF